MQGTQADLELQVPEYLVKASGAAITRGISASSDTWACWARRAAVTNDLGLP